MFFNASRGCRDVNDLTNEPAAARLLIAAGNSADGFQVLAIVKVALEHRWAEVVKAGARYFGEHPVAERIQELWDLTADRNAV